MKKPLIVLVVIGLIVAGGGVGYKWWDDSQTVSRLSWVDVNQPFPDWWSTQSFAFRLEEIERDTRRLDGLWFGTSEAAAIRAKFDHLKTRINETVAERARKKDEAEKRRIEEARGTLLLEVERQEGIRLAAEKKKREEAERIKAAALRSAKYAELAKEARTLSNETVLTTTLPTSLKGKAAILDALSLHLDHEKLPIALRANPDDVDVVFQVVGHSYKPGNRNYVAKTKAIPLAGVKSQELRIGSQIIALEVCVVNWKTKTPIGRFHVNGPEPPEFVTVPLDAQGYPVTTPITGPLPDLSAWVARCFGNIAKK